MKIWLAHSWKRRYLTNLSVFAFVVERARKTNHILPISYCDDTTLRCNSLQTFRRYAWCHTPSNCTCMNWRSVMHGLDRAKSYIDWMEDNIDAMWWLELSCLDYLLYDIYVCVNINSYNVWIWWIHAFAFSACTTRYQLHHCTYPIESLMKAGALSKRFEWWCEAS